MATAYFLIIYYLGRLNYLSTILIEQVRGVYILVILKVVYIQNAAEPKVHSVQSILSTYVNYLFPKNYRSKTKIYLLIVTNYPNIHYACQPKSEKYRHEPPTIRKWRITTIYHKTQLASTNYE